jgi:hypothetical protein
MKIRYNEDTGMLNISIKIAGNKGTLAESGRSFILGRTEGHPFQQLGEIHPDLERCMLNCMVIRVKPKKRDDDEEETKKVSKKKKSKSKPSSDDEED